MLSMGIPLYTVNVICNWYSKLLVSARWNDGLSSSFFVGSGVRQGSALSPAIFNIFMNLFISNSKRLGCCIYNYYLGCFLYADDIILLSPSVLGLQNMLDLCHATCLERLMLFNVNKSHCIIFGNYCKRVIECLTLGSARIDWWCTSLKYLGTNLTSSKTFTIDTNPLKRFFHAACNSIFSQTATLNDLISYSLQEFYCLPILTYACAAISLNPLDAGRRYTGFPQASKRRQTPVYWACANFSTSPATGIPGLCKLISPARHRYTGFIF